MNGWHNVSRDEPCPICQKPDWCNLSDDGCVCICHRVESPFPTKSGNGWIHRLKEGSRAPRPPQPRAAAPKPSSWGALDFARIHAGYDADPALLDGLATELGVSPKALAALDVRLNRLEECWSFPMRDAAGQIAGLRFRALGGREKWSARGSHDGLFVGGLCERIGELVVTEGASDTAVGLSLGLNAVGRSSCSTGGALLAAFVRARRIRLVTIVADHDAPGVRGAEALGDVLARIAATRILVVPAPWKDLREWYLSNRLTRRVFRDLASAALFRRAPLKAHAVGQQAAP